MPVPTLPPPPMAVEKIDSFAWKEWFNLLYKIVYNGGSGSLAAHLAATDPHTGYQKESEKNATGGYAGLDGSAHVPTTNLGSGTANSTTFLRGDQTWASVSGGVSDGDKGDITVSGSGATWTIDAGTISTTKMGGDVTTAGKALLDDANAADQRTTLGLGTAATANTGDFAAASHNHTLANVTDVTMSVANLNSLDDGVNSTLHFHNTDRDRANHTGTQTTSTISDFSEAVDDRVASLLVAGTNVTLTYNDASNSLTIDAAGGGGGSGLTHPQVMSRVSLRI